MNKSSENTTASEQHQKLITQKERDYNRIRVSIIHIFQQYPQISPSMLQICLTLRIEDWHPVLEDLISQGLIVRWNNIRETPITSRRQTYTTLLWAESEIVFGDQPVAGADTSRTKDFATKD